MAQRRAGGLGGGCVRSQLSANVADSVRQTASTVSWIDCHRAMSSRRARGRRGKASLPFGHPDGRVRTNGRSRARVEQVQPAEAAQVVAGRPHRGRHRSPSTGRPCRSPARAAWPCRRAPRRAGPARGARSSRGPGTRPPPGPGRVVCRWPVRCPCPRARRGAGRRPGRRPTCAATTPCRSAPRRSPPHRWSSRPTPRRSVRRSVRSRRRLRAPAASRQRPGQAGGRGQAEEGVKRPAEPRRRRLHRPDGGDGRRAAAVGAAPAAAESGAVVMVPATLPTGGRRRRHLRSPWPGPPPTLTGDGGGSRGRRDRERVVARRGEHDAARSWSSAGSPLPPRRRARAWRRRTT